MDYPTADIREESQYHVSSDIGAIEPDIEPDIEPGVSMYEIGVHDDSEDDGATMSMGSMSETEVDLGSEFDSESDVDPTIAGLTEIGADDASEVLRQLITCLRDERRCAPQMRAVSPDVAIPGNRQRMLISLGVLDQDLPLFKEYLRQFGAESAPRYVRIDTEESYQKFRKTPQIAELEARLLQLEQELHNHEADDQRHLLVGELEELAELGAEELAKKIPLSIPQDCHNAVTAWYEDGNVYVSVILPAKHGSRVVTAKEPLVKGLAEVSGCVERNAVPVAPILGALPAVGARLAGATAIKDIAAAAKELAFKAEYNSAAPCILRIEPRLCPTLAAMTALAVECKRGNQKACSEWNQLVKTDNPQLAQALREALAVAAM